MQRMKFVDHVQKLMKSMGLIVLEQSVDYQSVKPDLVAIYPNKFKYYVIEVMSSECFAKDTPRLYAKDSMQDYRIYYSKLFSDNLEYASIAATLICDLSISIDAFTYVSLGSHKFNEMSKYGCLAVPYGKSDIVQKVIKMLGYESGTLDVLEEFSLVLISKEDTFKLSEARKFVQFMLINR